VIVALTADYEDIYFAKVLGFQKSDNQEFWGDTCSKLVHLCKKSRVIHLPSETLVYSATSQVLTPEYPAEELSGKLPTITM
jgi:hypothetical protein